MSLYVIEFGPPRSSTSSVVDQVLPDVALAADAERAEAELVVAVGVEELGRGIVIVVHDAVEVDSPDRRERRLDDWLELFAGFLGRLRLAFGECFFLHCGRFHLVLFTNVAFQCFHSFGERHLSACTGDIGSNRCLVPRRLSHQAVRQRRGGRWVRRFGVRRCHGQLNCERSGYDSQGPIAPCARGDAVCISLNRHDRVPAGSVRWRV